MFRLIVWPSSGDVPVVGSYLAEAMGSHNWHTLEKNEWLKKISDLWHACILHVHLYVCIKWLLLLVVEFSNDIDLCSNTMLYICSITTAADVQRREARSGRIRPTPPHQAACMQMYITVYESNLRAVRIYWSHLATCLHILTAFLSQSLNRDHGN